MTPNSIPSNHLMGLNTQLWRRGSESIIPFHVSCTPAGAKELHPLVTFFMLLQQHMGTISIPIGGNRSHENLMNLAPSKYTMSNFDLHPCGCEAPLPQCSSKAVPPSVQGSRQVSPPAGQGLQALSSAVRLPYGQQSQRPIRILVLASQSQCC